MTNERNIITTGEKSVDVPDDLSGMVGRLQTLEGKVDSQNRIMLYLFGSFIAAMVGLIVSTIIVILHPLI
ncbi:MAG: hypothetical protein M1476_01065 [Candidatus Thermoplasmatota archaeon]|nr:hypothetical protein [Candidatus Thermoplasmatota archaeon]